MILMKTTFMLIIYRVANKFSDTLNELFVVNSLISKFFCENSEWKLVSSSHYLNSLKRDLRLISKNTFVSPFDTEPWKIVRPKNAISYSNYTQLQICLRDLFLSTLWKKSKCISRKSGFMPCLLNCFALEDSAFKTKHGIRLNLHNLFLELQRNFSFTIR